MYYGRSLGEALTQVLYKLNYYSFLISDYPDLDLSRGILQVRRGRERGGFEHAESATISYLTPINFNVCNILS